MSFYQTEVVIAAMKHLASAQGALAAQAFGLTENDLELFSSDKVWSGANRMRVEKINLVLSGGLMDSIGVSRFNVSAEYQAAIICLFVHPANVMAACDWFCKLQPNVALAEGVPETVSTVSSPQQLFALYLQAMRQDPGQYLRQFKELLHGEEKRLEES